MTANESALLQAFNLYSGEPAYVDGSATITFGDLAALSRMPEYAAARVEGVRAIVILPDCALAYLTHLALFLKRAVNVPLSIRVPTERAVSVLARIEPHLLITTRTLAARYAAAASLAPRTIIIDDSEIDSPSAVRSVLSQMSTVCADIRKEPAEVRYVMFTSGSTGEPKGVCLSLGNILSAARMNIASLGLDRTRRSIVGVPHFDYYGLIQIYSHALSGATLVPGRALMFPKDIATKLEGATDLVTVPFALGQMVRHVRRERIASFAKLKVITSSSDMLTDGLLQEVFELNPQVQVFDIYGLTEAGRACFASISADTGSVRHLGRPAPGVSIELRPVDESSDTGEIVISGPNVMLGYLRGVEDDHLVIKHYAEMKTGDLAVRTPTGNMRLVGRIGHMINIRGNKIHPSEIEGIATSLSWVREARASCIDADTESRIQLELVAADPAAADDAELFALLRQRLPAVFVPARITYFQDLRRTDIGAKLIR